MNKSQDEAKASGDGMTQSIRDAAQALLNAEDEYDIASSAHMKMPEGWRDGAPLVKAANTLRMCRETLRAAISAPQPTADERVAEHMRLVAAYGAQVQRDAFSGASLTLKLDVHDPDYSRIVAVEQSARALLSASQDDAEHAAMYRWLRDEWDGLPLAGGRKGFDAAIRAAMSAKETK